MKVWKIITNIDPSIADSIRDEVTEKENDLLNLLSETGQVYNWDLIEENKITPYFICEERILNILNGIFHKYGSEFEYVDITEDFLMGDYDIPDDNFHKYKLENLNEDIVYKKIILYGVDSLNTLDKKILDESAK